jgi:hypothetical protein
MSSRVLHAHPLDIRAKPYVWHVALSCGHSLRETSTPGPVGAIYKCAACSAPAKTGESK